MSELDDFIEYTLEQLDKEMKAKMKNEKYGDMADALMNCLITPNECDRNLENANIVDALFFVGRQIRLLAITQHPECFDETGNFIGKETKNGSGDKS